MIPKNYLDLAAGIANMQAFFIQCKRTHLGKKNRIFHGILNVFLSI